MEKQSGHPWTHKRVNENENGERHQRPANHSAATLQNDGDSSEGKNQFIIGEGLGMSDVLDDPVVVIEDVSHRGQPEEQNQDVVPGHSVRAPTLDD